MVLKIISGIRSVSVMDGITVKTGIQKACKDTDIGGAYVGKDGYDFEKITPEDVDEKQIARNVKAVQDFFRKSF